MDLYATPAQTFWRVTFPLVFPGILGAALLSFSLSFDDFIITNLNAGNTTTFPMFVWGAAQRGVPMQVNVDRHPDVRDLDRRSWSARRSTRAGGSASWPERPSCAGWEAADRGAVAERHHALGLADWAEPQSSADRLRMGRTATSRGREKLPRAPRSERRTVRAPSRPPPRRGPGADSGADGTPSSRFREANRPCRARRAGSAPSRRSAPGRRSAAGRAG